MAKRHNLTNGQHLIQLDVVVGVDADQTDNNKCHNTNNADQTDYKVRRPAHHETDDDHQRHLDHASL